jgi:hypothetical protein
VSEPSCYSFFTGSRAHPRRHAWPPGQALELARTGRQVSGGDDLPWVAGPPGPHRFGAAASCQRVAAGSVFSRRRQRSAGRSARAPPWRRPAEPLRHVIRDGQDSRQRRQAGRGRPAVLPAVRPGTRGNEGAISGAVMAASPREGARRPIGLQPAGQRVRVRPGLGEISPV